MKHWLMRRKATSIAHLQIKQICLNSICLVEKTEAWIGILNNTVIGRVCLITERCEG